MADPTPSASSNEAPGVPPYVFNLQIASIYALCNRYVLEAISSVSSSQGQVIPPDQKRMASYSTTLRAQLAQASATPQPDTPKTDKRQYPLESPPVVPVMDNQSVMDWIRLVEVFRDELCNSSSNRIPLGLISFDVSRASAALDAVDAQLKFIASSTPIDLPQSSPSAPMTPAGKSGV